MRKRTLPLAIAATLLAPAMLFIPSVYGNGSDSLRVSYINVGQGDSIWLHASDQTDILIDGGPRSAGPTVVAYLQNNTIDDIDVLVLSHGDADHARGMQQPSIARLETGRTASLQTFRRVANALDAKAARLDSQ